MRITKQNKVMNGFLEKFFIGLLTTCIVESFGRSLASKSKGPVKRVSTIDLVKLDQHLLI